MHFLMKLPIEHIGFVNMAKAMTDAPVHVGEEHYEGHYGSQADVALYCLLGDTWADCSALLGIFWVEYFLLEAACTCVWCTGQR